MENSTKTREIFAQIRLACLELAAGFEQLADDSDPGPGVVHAVEALREVHKTAASLLKEAEKGAFPLIYLNDYETRVLDALGSEAFGHTSVELTIAYILSGFVDGVRRSGSWERGCVVQFFGPEPVEAAAEEEA
jgi:hypothetical protein